MRPVYFIIFFTVFFAVYGLINYYILVRSLQSFSLNSNIRPYYIVLFIFVALSFLIGRILENYWLTPLSKTFVWVGAFWLAAMLYFFLGILLLDIIRFINHLFPFFPKIITSEYIRVKAYTGIGFSIVVFVLLIFGHLNAISPKIEDIQIKVAKKSRGMKSINIVVASDIHLGSIIGKKRFDKIVSAINSLKPDIVLLPGDIVDEDLAPVIKENLGESLRSIESRYGVYAVTGNHEYIGGVEDACSYLKENGVKVLRDQCIFVNNTLYLIGREDRSINRFTANGRESLNDLMNNVDKQLPIVLMDHQPFQLEEAKDAGIDLQLSGHTHHGQLWPLNYITNAVYENSWGYRNNSTVHYYISSGVGTWGPPIRIGNHPEIVRISLEFE
ncbi:MAG: metallophosphoesterase [Ignavibacteriales bacterium]|nr:metallophosphoesterase [Ignavibacteriales bacterium]